MVTDHKVMNLFLAIAHIRHFHRYLMQPCFRVSIVRSSIGSSYSPERGFDKRYTTAIQSVRMDYDACLDLRKDGLSAFADLRKMGLLKPSIEISENDYGVQLARDCVFGALPKLQQVLVLPFSRDNDGDVLVEDQMLIVRSREFLQLYIDRLSNRDGTALIAPSDQ